MGPIHFMMKKRLLTKQTDCLFKPLQTLRKTFEKKYFEKQEKLPPRSPLLAPLSVTSVPGTVEPKLANTSPWVLSLKEMDMV